MSTTTSPGAVLDHHLIHVTITFMLCGCRVYKNVLKRYQVGRYLHPQRKVPCMYNTKRRRHECAMKLSLCVDCGVYVKDFPLRKMCLLLSLCFPCVCFCMYIGGNLLSKRTCSLHNWLIQDHSSNVVVSHTTKVATKSTEQCVLVC